MKLYLGGADRDQLDPILDACVAVYMSSLDEDGQVDFKGKAKAFIRTYDFLASILPYSNAEWEKLSIFLNFLIPKLPAPKEEDLAKGILEAIDMDSYRAEKKATMAIALPDEDAEIEPVPTSGGGRKPEPEMDRLSQHPQGVQRPVRQHPLDRRRPGGEAASPRRSRQGRRRPGLPERAERTPTAERPHRARQGAGAGDDRDAQGRHPALQAVQRQRLLPPLADGYGLWADL